MDTIFEAPENETGSLFCFFDFFAIEFRHQVTPCLKDGAAAALSFLFIRFIYLFFVCVCLSAFSRLLFLDEDGVCED